MSWRRPSREEEQSRPGVCRKGLERAAPAHAPHGLPAPCPPGDAEGGRDPAEWGSVAALSHSVSRSLPGCCGPGFVTTAQRFCCGCIFGSLCPTARVFQGFSEAFIILPCLRTCCSNAAPLSTVIPCHKDLFISTQAAGAPTLGPTPKWGVWVSCPPKPVGCAALPSPCNPG